MSTQKPHITIVGLGLIGASMGLALRKSEAASVVVGHDRDPGTTAAAKKRGAVDRTHWQLIPACEKADLVILALPLDAIRETMTLIGPELRPGCVILDTASAKVPVRDWAAQALPDQVHYVGGDPIIVKAVDEAGGVAAARADLFQNGLFCLTPAPTADGTAIKLVSDLVTLLGAKPLFLDPEEHDGIVAAVEHLPSLLALALMETAARQPTWRELQKVAGASFARGTNIAGIDPAAQGELCVANRDNVVRWIDEYMAHLESLRALVAADKGDALGKRFQVALRDRGEWLSQREQGRWEEANQVEMPPKQSLLESLVGGFVSRRVKRE